MGLQGDLMRARRQMRDAPLAGVGTCAAVLRRFPQNRGARDMLAGLPPATLTAMLTEIAALLERGAWGRVLDLTGPLSRAHPAEPAFAAYAAIALARTGRGAEAIARVAPFLDAGPDDPLLLSTTALGHSALGAEDEAAAMLLRAVRTTPLNGALLNQYAGSLLALGRLDEAREVVEAAVALPHPAPKTWLFAAQLIGFRDRPDLLAGLNAAARRDGLTPTAQADLCFAGAKAAFDLDDPGGAFAHLARGNALIADLRPYHAESGWRDVNRTIRRVPPTARPAEDTTVILIVGMPRSGTTLVERILDAHPLVEGLGELMALETAMQSLPPGDGPPTRADLDRVADVYLAEAARHRRTDAPVIVDKMPSNAFRAGLALAALPGVRVLDLRRDPVAVGFSNWRHNFYTGNAFAYGIDRIAAQTALTRHAMRAWHAVAPDRIRTVPYEHLVENPAAEIASLLDWLGLPQAEACTAFRGARGGAVATTSAQQVRRGIYTGSSRTWHKYREWLGPMIAALSDATAEHEALLADRTHAAPRTDARHPP